MNAEDVAEWHDRSDAIRRAMNGVQKTSHAEQAAAIRELIAERDRLRAVLREAIEWNGEDDCGVPAVWLERARAALEPRK